jgi:hypothetical protein
MRSSAESAIPADEPGRPAKNSRMFERVVCGACDALAMATELTVPEKLVMSINGTVSSRVSPEDMAEP